MILRTLAAVVFWVSAGVVSAFAQTDTTPPTVPTGLTASAITINSFTLSWSASTDNVGVTGYEVFKGTVSLGTVTGLTLNVTGLAPNTTYAMKVRARDAAGKWSAQSTALSVKTLADTTPPAVPSGLVASANSASGFTLTWSATTDNVAVTGYEVFKNGVSLGATTALTKAITGLGPTTAYALTVRARDAVGNWSAQSPALNVTTLADTTAPSVPTGLATSAVTATAATLKWTAATDNVRVTGYEVFRDGVSLGLTTALSKALTGLAPTTAYALTVRARDAAGNFSPASTALTVTTAPDTTAPTVPAGLTASAATISSFLFKWNAATDNVAVTAYEIFRDGVSLGTTTAPTTSLSVTGLALSTTYAMTVRARDAAGNWSAPSAPRAVTTLADTTPPTVPNGLVASAATINSFTLTWNASTDNVGVTGYEVFRGNLSLGTTTALSLDLTGLAPNTGYSMRVRARDAAGKWSAQSVALIVRTLADTTAPAIPTGLATSAVSVTGLTLTWSAAPDDVATTLYEIFRNGVSLGTTTALSKTLTGLTPDTAYTFTVRARDAAANWSDLSSPLAVSTPPDTTAPSVPAGLNASVVSVSSLTLKWTVATDDVRVTGYEVFRDGISVGTATAASRNITGLTPDTAYTFTVRARDAAANWSTPSAPLAVATLPDTTPPAVPTALVASSVTGSGFTLRWTAPKDNVRTALYEVFRDGVSLGTSTATSRVLTGLFPETEYAMTARAADIAGNWSAQSLALPVTTLADTTAPSVPTALVTSAVTTTSLTLTWTASTDAVGVTLYEIFNGTISLGITTAATTINLTELTPATTYALRVRASDAAGNWSAPSAAKSIKTLADTAAPTIPSGLAATAITGTTLTLSWDPATDNVGVTAYEVFRGSVSQGITAAPTLNLTGLTLGTTYALKVRARDAAGNWSAQSAALAVTTYNDTTPPTVPDGLAATAVALNSLTLVWNASTDDVAVTAYEIFKNGASLGTTSAPSFNLTGLVLNTVYTMTVRARDATGNWSALSAPLAVSPAPDTVAPTAPDGLIASALTPTGFKLNWTAATDEVGVTAYEVFVNGVSVGTTTAPTLTLNALPPGGPAYVVTIRARDAAGNWSDVSAPLTVAINLVPFFTDFEPADGYMPGPLHGQNGWSVDGAAAIVTSPVYRGAQAVAVAPLANLSLVTRQFANSNPGVTFVDVFARPAGGTDPNVGTFFETDSAAVALTAVDGVSTLYFFNGDGTGGGDWQAVYPGPAVDANGLVTTWQRVTVRLDYAAKRWDLYLNGRMIAADLGFLDNTATSFTSLSLDGNQTLTTGFDDVFVGFENPLFLDADKDGMDDAWEVANGLNPAINDRNADLDGDGVSNLQEYLAGTGANIPNTATDTDGDGLPDAWEMQYLGTLSYSSGADPGGVGRSLLASYTQNLSPFPAAPLATGLRGWYRADLGAVQDVSGKISLWTDLSGSGFHGTQIEPTNRPQPIASQFNGLPVLRFNGTSHHINLPNVMAAATSGEVFVVAKLEDFTNAYNGLVHFGTGYGTIYSDGGVWNDFGTTDLGFYERPTNAAVLQPHLLDTSVSAQGVSVLILNGVEILSLTGQTVSFREDPVVGMDRYGECFRGDIAEVLVFDHVLTASERASVSDYLNAKYSLPLLPVPPPPILTAEAATATSVALTWTAPAGQSSVSNVERQLNGGGFLAIATVNNVGTYQDVGLVTGLTYEYRVKIANSSGTSDYSSPVSVSLVVSPSVPEAGMRLWFKADVGVSIDSVTGGVSSWADQSNHHNDAWATDVSVQPGLIPNTANGKPVLRFDGMNDYLEVPKFMPTDATEGELFVVVKVPNFATRDDGLWALGGADGTWTELQDTTRILTEDFGRSYRTAVGAPITPLTTYVVYNVSAKPDDWRVRMNGMIQHTETTNEVHFGENGWLGRVPGKYFLGDIAEVIAYDRVLTGGERGALNVYLSAKYILPPPAPATPSLTAEGISATSVKLTWTTPVGGLTITTIERQSNGSGFFAVGSVSGSESFTDVGLITGVTYSYRVRSSNVAGTSGYSSVVTILLVASNYIPTEGLRLWLKADSGVVVDGAGGVTDWADKSGAYKNAYGPDPSGRPLLVANAINGKPALRFDGVDDFLEIPKFMANATEGELFVVVKLPGFATRDDGLWSLGGADGTWTELQGANRIMTEDFGRSYRTAVGVPITPITNYVIYNVSAGTDGKRR
jgi:chitodextrinase